MFSLSLQSFFYIFWLNVSILVPASLGLPCARCGKGNLEKIMKMRFFKQLPHGLFGSTWTLSQWHLLNILQGLSEGITINHNALLIIDIPLIRFTNYYLYSNFNVLYGGGIWLQPVLMCYTWSLYKKLFIN